MSALFVCSFDCLFVGLVVSVPFADSSDCLLCVCAFWVSPVNQFVSLFACLFSCWVCNRAFGCVCVCMFGWLWVPMVEGTVADVVVVVGVVVVVVWSWPPLQPSLLGVVLLLLLMLLLTLLFV